MNKVSLLKRQSLGGVVWFQASVQIGDHVIHGDWRRRRYSALRELECLMNRIVKNAIDVKERIMIAKKEKTPG